MKKVLDLILALALTMVAGPLWADGGAIGKAEKINASTQAPAPAGAETPAATIHLAIIRFGHHKRPLQDPIQALPRPARPFATWESPFVNLAMALGEFNLAWKLQYNQWNQEDSDHIDGLEQTVTLNLKKRL